MCEAESGKRYWVRSHYKFLRKGDVFRILFGDGTDSGVLLAKSDPYINEKTKEWMVDIAT